MSEDRNINAVSLKLPPFWPDRAKFWFLQAEAQFSLRNIVADETKFFYIISSIDQDVADRVLDLLEKPPATDKYKTLKTRLIDAFTLDEARRADLLLEIAGLGDNTPSRLMDSMLALLGNHEPCFLFKRIFLRQLPLELRAHLISSKIEDCKELAKAADLLYHPRSFSTHAMRKMETPDAEHKTFKQSLKPDSAGKKNQIDSSFCYYHQTYGAKARQCRPPCNFIVPGNETAGRR